MTGLLTVSEVFYVIIEALCIIVKKTCCISIIMPKAFQFGIKIRNKSWKVRKNPLTAKIVIKTLRTEDKNQGQRAEKMVNI